MLYRTLTASAVLLAMAGCATRDAPVKEAWQIEPVFNVRHAFEASQAYYTLGRYHAGSKAWAKAIDAYRKAIAADAQNIEAYNALGVTLAQAGNFADAETTLRQAVALAPSLAHVRSNLGYVLLLAGKPDDALPELQAAVRQDTGDATAAANLRNVQGRIAVGKITDLAPIPASAAVAAPVVLPGQVAAVALTPLPAAATADATAAPAPRPAAVSTAAAAAASAPPQALAVLVTTAAALRVFDQPNVASLQGATVAAAIPAPIGPESAARSALTTVNGAVAPEQTSLRVFEQAATALAAPARPPTATPAVPERVMVVAATAVDPTPAARTSPAPRLQTIPAAALSMPRLEISNGNGITGMAASLGRWLAAQGVLNARLTNQLPYAQEQTVVQYRNGHEQAAQTLAHMMPATARLELARELRGDLRVVLGRDWQPVAACLEQDACPTALPSVAVAAAASAPIVR
jgi:hypothetical protein